MLPPAPELPAVLRMRLAVRKPRRQVVHCLLQQITRRRSSFFVSRLVEHMRRGLFAAFLLPALLASFPHPSIAMANEIELHWNELSGIALGRNVDLRLTDGTRVQGELLVVRPEALSIDVNKTSNKLTYPKGQREIPRASMSTLELRRIKPPDGAL